MKPHEINTELTDRMIRFLAGELSDSEALAFEAELAAGPDWEPVFRDLESVWRQTETSTALPPFPDADWGALQSRIQSDERDQTPIRKRKMRWGYGIAASILLVFGIWLGLSWSGPTNDPARTISFATTTEPDSVRLPDGTLIWLNRNSRLSYPETFAETERQVKLTGEAFFDVQRDPSHPFVIHGKDSEVRVLGTSFNVRALPEEDFVEVAVATGKVSFARLNQEAGKVLLLPGEQAILNDGATKPLKSEEPDPNYLAWKTGEIRFEHAPLRTVFRVLEKNHGKKLVSATPGLDTLHFRGDLSGMGLEEALEFMSLSLQLSYEDQDSLIVVKK